MQIKIIKGYRDSHLRRNVRRDEELTVPDARAAVLIERGVAEAMADPAAGRIAQLEDMLAQRDARIAELEGDSRFPCPHCDKSYASEAALQKHIKDKHPQPGQE